MSQLEIENMLSSQVKRSNLPVSFLREKVYPELYDALIQVSLIKKNG